MQRFKVRNIFLLDKVQKLIPKRHTNLTEVSNRIMPERVERPTNRRTGNFIGMLDGKIGNQSYKKLRSL